MREILFRGKRIDNGQWIEGDLIHSPDGRAAISTDDYLLEVKSETVCQYTGLKDRNGRKIFEEDIVKSDLDKIGKIAFNESHMAFTILEKEESRYYYVEKCDGNHIEIIGNIFDNPELIN